MAERSVEVNDTINRDVQQSQDSAEESARILRRIIEREEAELALAKANPDPTPDEE